MKKIVVINFVILILVLVLIELCSYVAYSCKYKEHISVQWANGNPVILKYEIPRKFSQDSYPYTSPIMRKFEKENSNKKPIAFVGCSFTKGSCLEDEETLAARVSELTNRTAYLRGVDATGLSYVYYQILHKIVPQDVEYVIYTYIFGHLERLYNYQLGFWSTELNLRYEYKNGELKEARFPEGIVNSLFVTKLIQEKLASVRAQEEQQTFKLFKIMMADLMVQFKKNYPNSKFVFISYPDSEGEHCKLPDVVVEYIKSLGCIYVDANELMGVNLGRIEYKVEGEGMHPNAQVWIDFAPRFVKELGL